MSVSFLFYSRQRKRALIVPNIPDARLAELGVDDIFVDDDGVQLRVVFGFGIPAERQSELAVIPFAVPLTHLTDRVCTEEHVPQVPVAQCRLHTGVQDP
jgi:hypothetical protein